MPSRYGTIGKSKQQAVPWVAEAFSLEKGSNHTPSPGAKLRQGGGLCGSGLVVP